MQQRLIRHLLLLLFFAQFSFIGWGQYRPTSFEQYFGGANTEVLYSVESTLDTGYIMCGYTTSYGEDNKDMLITKLDRRGDMEWSRTIGENMEDIAKVVRQATDKKNYVVGGYSIHTEGFGQEDIVVSKIDTLGMEIWTKYYGGEGEDILYDLQPTSDGGYIVVGSTNSYGAGGVDIYIIKINSDGKHEWSKTYGGTSDDIGVSIKQSFDGGYIIAGKTESFGIGSPGHFYLLKITSTGAVQWSEAFGGTGIDEPSEVIQAPDGTYYMIGSSNSDVFTSDGTNGIIIYSTKSGKVSVYEEEGLVRDEFGTSIDTLNGLLIVGGWYDAPNQNGSYILEIATSNEGRNMQMTRKYGADNNALIHDTDITLDKGFISVGNLSKLDNTESFILKTNDKGETWCQDAIVSFSVTSLETRRSEIIPEDESFLSEALSLAIPNRLISITSTFSCELLEYDTLGGAYSPRELLVVYKDGVLQEDKVSLREEYGAILKDSCVCNTIELWELSDTITIGNNVLIDMEAKKCDVDSKNEVESGGAGRNYRVKLNGLSTQNYDTEVLNKNLIRKKKELENAAPLHKTFSNQRNASNEYEKVKIAIIDSGIDGQLEDFIWKNMDYANGDSNCVEDYQGWDFINHQGLNPIPDNLGHGTAVAGRIINAYHQVPMEQDILDLYLVDSITLINLKVFEAGIQPTLLPSICAIYHSRTVGADIVNASFGYVGEKSLVLENAIDALRDSCILLVASAGNDSTDVDIKSHYPSGLPLDNIISVTATPDSEEFKLDDYANWGVNSVDIAYTGRGTFLHPSNISPPQYGTSFSTAVVTGRVAYLKSRRPDASYLDLITALTETVEDRDLPIGTMGIIDPSVDVSKAYIDTMLVTPCINLPICDEVERIEGDISEDSTFYAVRTIQSRAKIIEAAQVVFKAGERIQLVSGFSVTSGSRFHALTEAVTCYTATDLPPIEIPYIGTPPISNDPEESRNGLKAYPNPFSDLITIDYFLPATTAVYIDVYNHTGQKIQRLAGQQNHPRGKSTKVFYAKNLPQGLYYIQALIGEERISKKVLLIK